VALVDQLLDEVWVGPWAVALNPGWYGGDVPAQYSELVASWEAAYMLMITATQVGGCVWFGHVVQIERESATHDPTSITV
jgi:hypothetical protein